MQVDDEELMKKGENCKGARLTSMEEAERGKLVKGIVHSVKATHANVRLGGGLRGVIDLLDAMNPEEMREGKENRLSMLHQGQPIDARVLGVFSPARAGRDTRYSLARSPPL